MHVRSEEPAARPIEKAILHRIMGLHQMNIQLLFVFDGPHRPWKRGRRGGNEIDYADLKLTKELLSMLRVHKHEAPGEAEAECARLETEGVVDAVRPHSINPFQILTGIRSGRTTAIRSCSAPEP